MDPSALRREERASKMRKVERMRRQLPHMSQSAFAAMISDVRAHGLPDFGDNRHELREARSALLDVLTDYGPLIREVTLAPPAHPPPRTTIETAHRKLEYVCPHAYIWHLFSMRGSYFQLIRDTFAARPSTHDAPWRVIIYGGEVQPGRELAQRHARKIWSF